MAEIVSVKDSVLRAVKDMPESITFEEVMEHIYLLQKIEKGRHELAEGKGIPHEEVKRQIGTWHG